MGITGKVAMPLLSTLAALVIIVHSTEQDTESDYRGDLRPRILDDETPTYEQPWRVIDQEGIIQKDSQGDSWNDASPEEPRKRRRPGRKRKRRPQSSFSEEQVPHDMYGYPEEPSRPYFEEEVPHARQTTETVKRRRRKPEGRLIGWSEGPLELERPFRRRGQRRKRPALDAWSELSEFNGYNDEEIPKETIKDTNKKVNNVDNSYNHQSHDNQNENISLSTAMDNDDFSEQTQLVQEPDFPLDPHEKDLKFLSNKPEHSEDKSLSEFSVEVMTQAHKPRVEEVPTRLESKLGDKASSLFNEYDKLKEKGPLDPVSLKDILKRSNGSSLSEILQQHNLSLADLLRGKENAISILKSEDPFAYRKTTIADIFEENSPPINKINMKEHSIDYGEGPDKTEAKEIKLLYSKADQTIDGIPQSTNSKTISIIQDTRDITHSEEVEITTISEKQETVTPKSIGRIRFPTGLRKKIRLRPMMNTTYKAQLSRDLLALNARKYIHHRRNNTKSRQWKNIIPSLINTTTEQTEKIPVTNSHVENSMVEEIRTTENRANYNISALSNNEIKNVQFNDQNLNVEVTTQAYTTTKVIVTEIFTNITGGRPKIPVQPGEITENRKQSFNRRKKRIRQKSSTTETPQENVIKNFFEMNEQEPLSIITRPNLSEINEENEDFQTNLEDFMTTRPSVIQINVTRPSNSYTKSTTTRLSTTQSTTEETVKFEIDEILNDTGASKRLSKILMERNMTLSELVEHRERGSSHVHLADIFHNASKEPNPPEPFLSKSLIEPISKETYPLRAILEANLHDASVKATTIDSNMIESNYVNIPVVMDFGNNVNENAENMGIMSLFSNFTRLNVIANNNKKGTSTHSTIQPRKPEVITEIATQVNNTSTNQRESRVLSDVVNRDNQDDVASWKAIFSLMEKNYKNESKDLQENINDELSPSEDIKILTDDIDGDSFIVLEDLQHLKDFDNNIASVSDEKLEFNSMETGEMSSGILEIIPSQTKSVTVATACIAGLAIVLFLLTYAAFKWKQQRGIGDNKHNFNEERLPTPVFENRKSHKNNSSTRSISPMLSTSNIYTLNTLDSRNGKESPEYMWDTLRKPFQ